MADLFSAYTAGYDRERQKFLKAVDLKLHFILAIEGSVTEVLKGHHYWNGDTRRESRKSGLAMLRQLCTVERKYRIGVWYCTSRTEMALKIQEYFLSADRLLVPSKEVRT